MQALHDGPRWMVRLAAGERLVETLAEWARRERIEAGPQSGQQLLAGRGQRKRAWTPAKQLHPAMILEQPDVVADRRRGEPELVGGVLEAQPSRRRFKSAQRAQRRQASHPTSIDEFRSSIT